MRKDACQAWGDAATGGMGVTVDILRTIGGKAIMGNVALFTTTLVLAAGLAGIGLPRTAMADKLGVAVTVICESWDACSRGFAYYM